MRPDDIAAVKIADKAELKVTAYDSSRYGKIKGEVATISPTTFESDDKRSHYYKVVIRFDPGGRRYALVCMAASAGHDGRRRNHLRQQVAAAVSPEADLSRPRHRFLGTLVSDSPSPFALFRLRRVFFLSLPTRTFTTRGRAPSKQTVQEAIDRFCATHCDVKNKPRTAKDTRILLLVWRRSLHSTAVPARGPETE